MRITIYFKGGEEPISLDHATSMEFDAVTVLMRAQETVTVRGHVIPFANILRVEHED